jgi:hypothetical protein
MGWKMRDSASMTRALVAGYPCASAPPLPLIYILYTYIGKGI